MMKRAEEIKSAGIHEVIFFPSSEEEGECIYLFRRVGDERDSCGNRILLAEML